VDLHHAVAAEAEAEAAIAVAVAEVSAEEISTENINFRKL
jgi:hypothetical protein